MSGERGHGDVSRRVSLALLRGAATPDSRVRVWHDRSLAANGGAIAVTRERADPDTWGGTRRQTSPPYLVGAADPAAGAADVPSVGREVRLAHRGCVRRARKRDGLRR